MFDNVGRLIARLQKPGNHCEPLTPNGSTAVGDTLRPREVLPAEGKSHISGGIQYLTQSTSSHSASPDRRQHRRRCRVGAAVAISVLSNPLV